MVVVRDARYGCTAHFDDGENTNFVMYNALGNPKMNTQITIHEIINGTGETVGWSVLRNKAEKIAEFTSLFDACEFATQQEQTIAAACGS